MGQEKIKFGHDENGNVTMTVFDEKDHHDVGNPHAHDIDVTKPAENFNEARGEARSLTEEEREEFYPESNEAE